MNDEIAAILAQCGPPNERLLTFEKVLHLCGDNIALIQAITTWGAMVRADERERCAARAGMAFVKAAECGTLISAHTIVEAVMDARALA